MSDINDTPNLAHLLQYQIRAAERIRDEIIRDAELTLLADIARWQWLTKMNECSIAQRCQIYPDNPPASIMIAA